MENQTPPIENKDLHWRDERRRADDNTYAVKGVWILIGLAAILVLNLLLVSAVQLMTDFTHTQPDAVLSEYPGYTLLDTAEEEAMTAYLIRTSEGGSLLVTAEKHFLFNRWQLISAEPAGTNPPNARGDTHSLSATVEGDTITSLSVIGTGLHISYAGLPERIPVNALLYTGVLFLLELALWFVFRKIRNS